jgi:very-short-patch-repair endonuclease
MESKEIATEEVKYPCPKCGHYYKPFMYDREGFALMLCETCNCQYKTSTRVSANFRKFCQKLGSAPNRSPTYYTSSETVVQRFLIRHGLREGLEFFHNSRVGPFVNDNKHKVYFWCDFVVPKYTLILEASPHIWHKMWNREQADNRKELALNDLGWKVINLDEKDLHQLNKIRKEKKYPKTERVKEVYGIFGCEKEYVKYL